jgi:hypothetical protein
MSGNWKIDRPFTYEGVNGYYVNKIAAFPIEVLAELPREIPSDLAELGTHLRQAASEQGLTLTPCDPAHMYLWGEEIARQGKQALLWRYREYVFALSMRFIGQLAASPEAAAPLRIGAHPPRIRPATFRIEDHSFTIVGSSELTSDIDITIQGPHSSFLIAILEDLFRTLTEDHGIPIRCWDVEFYGDFRLLRSVFVNFHKWNPSQRILLLKYALVSYFRSTHQVTQRPPVVHPNVTALVHRALRMAGTNPAWIPRAYQAVVKNAYDFWRQTAPNGVLNRELFYRELGKVESDSATIRLLSSSGNPSSGNPSSGKVSNNTAQGSKAQEFAFGLFTAMATANIHRAESYVLPSTAVHVVEWEQKKAGPSNAAQPLPASWFASNARIGIDPFGFVLSAIEQLGYLEHYHPPNVPCSKKGIKYFGRYVRALVQAGVLPADTPLKPVYEQLNAYRSTKDPSVPCPYNVHDLLKQILQAQPAQQAQQQQQQAQKQRGGRNRGTRNRGTRNRTKHGGSKNSNRRTRKH